MYPPQKLEINGKKGLIENFSIRHAQTITMHQGFMPEISFENDYQAKGIWSMSDYIVSIDEVGNRMISHGFGYYHESYTYENEKWKIQSILLERTLITHPISTVLL